MLLVLITFMHTEDDTLVLVAHDVSTLFNVVLACKFLPTQPTANSLDLLLYRLCLIEEHEAIAVEESQCLQQDASMSEESDLVACSTWLNFHSDGQAIVRGIDNL